MICPFTSIGSGLPSVRRSISLLCAASLPVYITPFRSTLSPIFSFSTSSVVRGVVSFISFAIFLLLNNGFLVPLCMALDIDGQWQAGDMAGFDLEEHIEGGGGSAVTHRADA